MTEQEKMARGALYHPACPTLRKAHLRAQRLVQQYNALPPEQENEREALLRTLLGSAGCDVYIEPNFRCDYGCNITVGDRFFANYDCILLDVGAITIGNDVMFGPRVSLLTASHPLDREVRASGLEYGRPIVIGDDVWLGGGVIVNPGVTIGSGTVVGSGAVVTRDLPEGVVAVGNPCRVLRPITQADRDHWQNLRRVWEET